MGNPTPFLEIIINLLKQLDERGLSYKEAIIQLENTIKIINNDINKMEFKGETKQSVAQDRN